MILSFQLQYYAINIVVGKHTYMNIGIYNVNYVSNNKILSYDAKNITNLKFLKKIPSMINWCKQQQNLCT